MARAECIRVEVAYARIDRQWLMELQVDVSSTIEQVIRRSGILAEFPEIDLDYNAVGIFGRQAHRRDGLRDGDRVEIYRPLRIDPKTTRRQRASKDNG